MRLESARGLKLQLLKEVVEPFVIWASRLRGRGTVAVASAAEVEGLEESPLVFGVGARPLNTLPAIHRSVALGIARHQGDYKLAVRIQRPSLIESPLMEHLARQAKGEVDVRIVGRIDKRVKAHRAVPSSIAAAAAVIPWYQRNTRPLSIGASVGHVDVTAGTIGAFVGRGRATYLLSNNHVLAKEDQAAAGDPVLQRAKYDGGREPSERVARLRFWIKLKKTGANIVDAALAEIDKGILYDVSRLRGLVKRADRTLAGVGPAFIDEGETVFKIGRTTGPTEGRVTAFDLDNVVVNYDKGNLRFDGQIEIEGVGKAAFSDGGDSGSLIVNARMKAAALLFAGGDSGGSNGLGLTYANPIQHVLKALKATLLF
ncbi:MAG TPA: hypothetical protein VGJ39_06385 [Vicinamibacterales bacterium]